jgi:hypothetical protein
MSLLRARAEEETALILLVSHQRDCLILETFGQFLWLVLSGGSALGTPAKTKANFLFGGLKLAPRPLSQNNFLGLCAVHFLPSG